MCGIFGYIGNKKAIKIALDGLRKLEYRGYDSSGLAAISQGKLIYLKKPGKMVHLEEAVPALPEDVTIAISHTRWATHGKPSETNAHPQMDVKSQCAVVHNGIIENHDAVRRLLEKRGIVFNSETDTEVIPQLISYLYKGNLLKAVQRALPLLKGAFALAAIHENHPRQIVCAARESPLAIGIGQGEMFIASDSQAFLKHTKKAIYLHSSEVALISENTVEAYNERSVPIAKETEDLGNDAEEVTKGKYPHYTLKEIYEQPQTIQNTLLSRYCEEFGKATFDEIKFTDEELQKIQQIVIIACGTSYHAGLLGSYMLQERARIPVQVEISSEFRYKNPIILPNTLAIVISQSGETADTLAAMHEIKEKGALVLGICNVQGSTLSRYVDSCLFLRAGPEIGVASTKAFTSQLILFALLTLRFARMRTMSQKEGKDFIHALNLLPEMVKKVLEQSATIESIAKAYTSYQNFFFIGRRLMYPTALEGALKLKEIAYVNANGYAAGELKHGPIALIHEDVPTIAFCADHVTYPKILSNLMEIKARNGKIVAIAPEGSLEIEKIADHVIWIPNAGDELLTPILSTVASQLLAYHFANALGLDIDQPKNLAKSVTVE